MTDIGERLAYAIQWGISDPQAMADAKDEIERLRGEVKVLHAGLGVVNEADRAENERLHNELAEAQRRNFDLAIEIERLRAKVKEQDDFIHCRGNPYLDDEQRADQRSG